MADPTEVYNNPPPVPAEYLPGPIDPDKEIVYEEGDHPTDNPHGVTVSTDDYWPKCQEEKAEALMVEMVEPVTVAPNEPYPSAPPPGPVEPPDPEEPETTGDRPDAFVLVRPLQ